MNFYHATKITALAGGKLNKLLFKINFILISRAQARLNLAAATVLPAT
jgi:hypothetical protein